MLSLHYVFLAVIFDRASSINDSRSATTIPRHTFDVINARENDVVQFRCENSMNCQGLIWRRFDEEVVLTVGDRVAFLSDRVCVFNHGAYLELGEIEPSDQGIYECVCEDFAGSSYVAHGIFLRVIVPPAVRIRRGEQNITVYVNTVIDVACRASGNPQPSVVWFRGGEYISNGSRLYIPNAKLNHAGIYSCLADNNVGRPAIATLVVDIIASPAVQINHEIHIVSKGSNVSIDCLVDGIPTPTVKWYFVERAILSNDVLTQCNATSCTSTLNFVDVELADLGDYVCRAENPYGHAEAIAHLTVLPGAIVMESIQTGSESVALLWSVDTADPILFYRITYGEVGSDVLSSLEVSSDPINNSSSSFAVSDSRKVLQNYLLEHLKPSTSYRVRVQAYNVNGWGSLAGGWLNFETKHPRATIPTIVSQSFVHNIMDPLLLLSLAVILAFFIFVIYRVSLLNKDERRHQAMAELVRQNEQQERRNEQRGAGRTGPVVVGGRRRNVGQNRRRQERDAEQEREAVDLINTMDGVEGSEDDEDEGTRPGVVLPEGVKVGKKKLAKLEAKAEKRQAREAELIEREDRKQREAEREAKLKSEEEKFRKQEEEEEERQRKEQEEKERREQEEYLAMKAAFSIDEEGYDETQSLESTDLLNQFIDYVKMIKVCNIDELASHFKLRTPEVVDRLRILLEGGTLTGLMDDRGKFIYITEEELQAVAKFINQRGRVSVQEIVERSNELIDLEPQTTAVA